MERRIDFTKYEQWIEQRRPLSDVRADVKQYNLSEEEITLLITTLNKKIIQNKITADRKKTNDLIKVSTLLIGTLAASIGIFRFLGFNKYLYTGVIFFLFLLISAYIIRSIKSKQKSENDRHLKNY